MIWLTEHFIGGFNHNTMTDDILREVTTLENIEEATGEHVLIWVQVEVQREHGSIKLCRFLILLMYL